MNAIEHLETRAWKHPDCYGGFSPDGDFLVLSRTRDYDLLDRVNWDVACESLQAEAYDAGRTGEIPADRPKTYHWRAGHPACGWVEYLMVRADAPDDIKTNAGEIICALAEYPVLSDDKFSEAEWNAVCAYWEQLSVADRLDELRRAGLSIFAARRDTLPQDDDGSLFQRLSEGL